MSVFFWIPYSFSRHVIEFAWCPYYKNLTSSVWDHESPQPPVHCRSLKCLPIRSRLNPVMSKARWVRYSLLSSGFFVFTMSLSVSDSSKTLFSLYIRRHFNWLFLINISVLFIYFFPKISSLLTCSVHGIPSILL